MGMFDYLTHRILCPNCKRTSEIELQTKSGQCTLMRYKLGDKFNFSEDKLKYEKDAVAHHSKPNYLIWLLGSCRKCECQIEGCAWINQKTLIIEEIELFSYKVKIEPEISYKI